MWRTCLLATLLVGLGFVFWAPTAKADCPHGGTNFDHPHCSGGEPPPPAASNEFRFIGFTDEANNALPDTINGGQGMLAMHALCQDDFGENVRMCTDKEFWLSPNAEAPTANSWTHHTGFIFEGANCLNWTDVTTGEAGGGVDIDGKPFIDTCNFVRPVTCCAPIQ